MIIYCYLQKTFGCSPRYSYSTERLSLCRCHHLMYSAVVWCEETVYANRGGHKSRGIKHKSRVWLMGGK